MTAWKYEWIDAGHGLHLYARWRYENTLDGMAKPYAETLAYVQLIRQKQWRILLHQPDEVIELDENQRFKTLGPAIILTENLFKNEGKPGVDAICQQRHCSP